MPLRLAAARTGTMAVLAIPGRRHCALVWANLAVLPSYVVQADGHAVISDADLAEAFSANFWFSVLGVLGGAAIGVATWIMLRMVGWPVALLTALLSLLGGKGLLAGRHPDRPGPVRQPDGLGAAGNRCAWRWSSPRPPPWRSGCSRPRRCRCSPPRSAPRWTPTPRPSARVPAAARPNRAPPMSSNPTPWSPEGPGAAERARPPRAVPRARGTRCSPGERAQQAALESHRDGVRAGSVEAVHRSRVAVRRLQVLFTTFSGLISDDRGLRRRLRRFGLSLGEAATPTCGPRTSATCSPNWAPKRA